MLLDEKSFLDYKLGTNMVDTYNEQILQHQRHFRGTSKHFGTFLSETKKLN